jgi:GDP/UDP-N,N'-diacetylbacillosamine 2-epimerase (hydrolysing)
MRKICIFTSSRADYYLLSKLSSILNFYKNVKVQMLVSGTHLLNKYGSVSKEIRSVHKNVISCKIIDNMNSDNLISEIFSKSVKVVGEKLRKTKPDLFVVLGDRYEALAATIASNLLKIPIAHISGGEITEGAMDDCFRHSMTKLSNIHFVSNHVYKKRVIQLGENKKNIYVVGSTGSENTYKIKFLKKEDLEKILNLKFLKRNLIITLHPETINSSNNKKIINSLFPVLTKIKNTLVIFTAPNIDPGSKFIEKSILRLVKNNKNFKYYKNLGSQKYFSCIKYCDAVIGNSSSGIYEVPSLKKFTINLGDRQKGRLFAKSIINTKLSSKDIKISIKKIYDKKFQKHLINLVNPYYKKNTALNIAKTLKTINLKKILNKQFVDIR